MSDKNSWAKASRSAWCARTFAPRCNSFRGDITTKKVGEATEDFAETNSRRVINELKELRERFAQELDSVVSDLRSGNDTQIKGSAAEQVQGVDPKRPRFSRCQERTGEDERRRLGEIARDFGSKNWKAYLGAIPRRYLPDFAEPGMAAALKYIRVAQRMDAYQNGLTQVSAEIVKSATKYVWTHKKVAQKLFGLMHDATITGIDPDVEYEALTTADETNQIIRTLQDKALCQSLNFYECPITG